jgi:hypothetical protein
MSVESGDEDVNDEKISNVADLEDADDDDDDEQAEDTISVLDKRVAVDVA